MFTSTAAPHCLFTYPCLANWPTDSVKFRQCILQVDRWDISCMGYDVWMDSMHVLTNPFSEANKEMSPFSPTPFKNNINSPPSPPIANSLSATLFLFIVCQTPVFPLSLTPSH